MRAGYQVEAAFMKNWSSTTGLKYNECPWLDDRREALKVAAHLGITLHTFDFEKEYTDKVMQYFFEEYRAGRTPNPDVMCNKEIKFKILYERAMKMGFDFMATGHYAQIKKNSHTKQLELVRSKDEFKDQTYFIYNLKTEQLGHILFPIGAYLKSEVRAMARKFKLPNAERKESMGICFVGKVRLDQFLQQKIPARKGLIVDSGGRTVGEHRGVSYYTLGQRDGLNIGGTGPYYVMKKDLKANTLVVTKNPDDKQLMFGEIEVSALNWITGPNWNAQGQARIKGRFRHQQELQDIMLEKLGKGLYRAKFKHPQRAVASGQSLVLYLGKVCLGGGVIV